jgi:V8-like Glu-specific endopeptidase
MTRRHPQRISRIGAVLVVALIGVEAATGTAIAGEPKAAGERVMRAPVEAAERAVRRYWTAERMRAAVPIEQRWAVAVGSGASGAGGPGRVPTSHGPVNRFEIADTREYPARVHGKVFLTYPGEGDFVCSGTVVGSPAGNVVVTAGHCVFDAGISNQWATNWLFIPGYRDGQEPFGRWVAQNLAAPTSWVQDADIRFDVGGAEMVPRAGAELEQEVGARGIAFEQNRNQLFRAFGYPAQQPPLEFTGGRLFACDSPYGGDDTTEPSPSPIRIACDMTQGSSGGGWVIDNAYVNSVVSYGYLLEPNDLYGPYFGSEAKAVYERVAGTARCFGTAPTLVGTGASETLAGTPGTDVILALGGDDTVKPGGGSDLVCGGPGADSVLAGPGEDRLGGQSEGDELRGQAGRDTLNGGPDEDLCVGGPRRDEARRCEDKRHV